MTHWGDRSNGTIRGEVDRSSHPWPVVGQRVRGDRRAVYAAGELVVEAHYDDDAVTVILAGEFDLPMAGPVRETLTHAIGESRQLILDLTEVTFIDSSGLHVILDTYNLCLRRGPEPMLTIRPGPPNVQRVFALTNLLHHLPFKGPQGRGPS